MNLSIMKNVYLMATMSVVSFFIAMFIVSGYWFCLLPVVLVVSDFIKTIREQPAAQPAVRVNNAETSSNSISSSTSSIFSYEFIKEEEFKI